ncbi:hypothetical protein RN001_003438 [Aquatica leii]|uniref:Uncharacterized protein n=1 Tax=Aquatica leii TaxID=1421715 RepID=A0AAN7Q9J4_9COLE|nr:hypothetical protein RN001_003438 [Aquatica leii]
MGPQSHALATISSDNGKKHRSSLDKIPKTLMEQRKLLELWEDFDNMDEIELSEDENEPDYVEKQDHDSDTEQEIDDEDEMDNND